MSRCLSSTEHYWISLLFGYKAIIQAIGLYLAFKIRKIKIRGLNDSREVSIILYVTSVIMLVILVNNFAFGDYIDVDGFVYGFGLSTAVTVVLCLTFIPKVWGGGRGEVCGGGGGGVCVVCVCGGGGGCTFLYALCVHFCHSMHTCT